MHKDHCKALQLRRERLTALVGGKDSTPIPPELTKLSNVEVEAVWAVALSPQALPRRSHRYALNASVRVRLSRARHPDFFARGSGLVGAVLIKVPIKKKDVMK